LPECCATFPRIRISGLFSQRSRVPLVEHDLTLAERSRISRRRGVTYVTPKTKKIAASTTGRRRRTGERGRCWPTTSLVRARFASAAPSRDGWSKSCFGNRAIKALSTAVSKSRWAGATFVGPGPSTQTSRLSSTPPSVAPTPNFHRCEIFPCLLPCGKRVFPSPRPDDALRRRIFSKRPYKHSLAADMRPSRRPGNA
jgi:hypothetical protein